MLLSQEQIDQANQTDLVSFLMSQGEELRQEGKNYRWSRHDSVMVQGNRWIRNSNKKNEKGYPIQFVETFYNLPFREAVFLLLGSGATPAPMMTGHREKKQFRLPDPDNNTDHVKKYLTGRGVSLAVIQRFIDRGDLYQEKGRFHNCVFVGRDLNGSPRYCFKRGTQDYTDRDGVIHKFRNESEGSDKRFSFSSAGTNDRLCLFESCIDLLSFMTLFPDSCNSHLLSLAGTGQEALSQYIADHPGIKSVFLCLDNDPAGKDASVRLSRILPVTFTVGRLTPTQYKDWNELLQHSGAVSELYRYEKQINR